MLLAVIVKSHSEEVAQIEGVGVVILGTQFRNRIVEFVEEYQRTHQTVIHVADVMTIQSF